MVKHYIIEDLQTQEFSHFTTVEGIFDLCVEDYMGNDWDDGEVEELEDDFAGMTEEDKLRWVEDIYEYKFHYAPDVITIHAWEEFTGKNWEVEKLRDDE